MGERSRSEQDENLELATEPPLADPPSWAEQDPDRAEPAGTGRDDAAGPEHDAMRVDDEPDDEPGAD
jgi:hypothetical protein